MKDIRQDVGMCEISFSMFREKRFDVFLFFVQKPKKFVQKIMEILRSFLFVPASLLWNVGNYVYCFFSLLLLNCLFVKKK